jgi:hypothetical protein
MSSYERGGEPPEMGEEAGPRIGRRRSPSRSPPRRRSRSRSRSPPYGGRAQRRSRSPPRYGYRDRGPPPPHRDYPPPPYHGRGGGYDDRYRPRDDYPPPPYGDYPRGGPPPPHHHHHGPPPPFDYPRGGPPPFAMGGPPPFRRDRSPRRGGRRDEGPPGVSLLVRNLGSQVTSADLTQAFARIGELRDVYIPRDYHCKLFMFVLCERLEFFACLAFIRMK